MYKAELSFDDIVQYGESFWKDVMYKHNVVLFENIDLDRGQFAVVSDLFGHNWTKDIYDLYAESYEEDEITDWSNRTGLKNTPLPWHRDMPFHEKWCAPIRVLYSASIPENKGGHLGYTNTAVLYDNLTEKEQSYFENLEVEITFYKNTDIRRWEDFILINPITGQKFFNVNAFDKDVDFYGLRKRKDYIPGKTAIQSIRKKDTKEVVSLDIITDVVKSSVSLDFFEHQWKEKQFLVTTNLDYVHCRTEIEECEKERLLWRRTLFHDYQYKLYLKEKENV
jgi:alpha-ketoglutarate-dependent taurine dioxygenase